jgi:hypothetical protein
VRQPAVVIVGMATTTRPKLALQCLLSTCTCTVPSCQRVAPDGVAAASGRLSVAAATLPQRRYGTNVHWVECSPGQPCPSEKDCSDGGGPKPGEVAQLGRAFGRARTGVRWNLVEQACGVYNFSMYDRLVGELDAAGVGLYGIFAFGNPLYNCSYLPISPLQQEAFARFAVAMVAHFRGRGVVWELWK